jgi:hypothetical protein
MAAMAIVVVGCAAAAQRSPEAKIGFVRFLEGRSGVFTIRPDGARAMRVSQISGRADNPEFSSDGDVLAYDRSFLHRTRFPWTPV